METSQSAEPIIAPTAPGERIEALDVLRGFALLGILLLNIVGFGMHSAGYFNPMVGIGSHPTLNLAVWGVVAVGFEGAMRTLFSMLFGAGVVLFTAGGASGIRKGAGLHYRRTFWLLAFGLFDAYVLLWSGDILIVYAIAGALLYPARNLSARTLLVLGGLLLVLTSAFYGISGAVLAEARDAAAAVAADPLAEHTAEREALARTWLEFERDFSADPADQQPELEARRADYAAAFAFNLRYMSDALLFVIPVYLLWDALAMMLIGMGCYRLGVLSATRSTSFYLRITVIGFTIGLAFNGYELIRAIASGFDLIEVFSYFQATYHAGRLGMALGWLGVVMLMVKGGVLAALQARLAAVGRTALTNYLLHSLICLFLFTGAGLALVGELERWALYPIVFAIWAVQLMLSPWWLERYAFGPAEWLWRSLTYGARQRIVASR